MDEVQHDEHLDTANPGHSTFQASATSTDLIAATILLESSNTGVGTSAIVPSAFGTQQSPQVDSPTTVEAGATVGAYPASVPGMERQEVDSLDATFSTEELMAYFESLSD